MLFISPYPDRPPDAEGAGNDPWAKLPALPLALKGNPP